MTELEQLEWRLMEFYNPIHQPTPYRLLELLKEARAELASYRKVGRASGELHCSQLQEIARLNAELREAHKLGARITALNARS